MVVIQHLHEASAMPISENIVYMRTLYMESIIINIFISEDHTAQTYYNNVNKSETLQFRDLQSRSFVCKGRRGSE